MIKRLILIALFLSSPVFAVTDAQLERYFKAQIPVSTVKVNVTSRVSVDSIEGMEYVSVDISDGSRTQKVSVFIKGNLIFPDVIDVSSGSIKEKLDRQKLIKKLSVIYQAEDKKNIVILGDDPKKKTLVKFTDPECPFCQKEIAKIEEKLKNYNLRLIFTPVYGKSSLKKSALIYRQTSIATTLEQKVQIVKKYFSSNVDEEVSEEEIERIDALRKKYFSAGLRGVPLYINEKDLLK